LIQHIGEWSRSSKLNSFNVNDTINGKISLHSYKKTHPSTVSDNSYGLKGEALACLRQLSSTVEVVTSSVSAAHRSRSGTSTRQQKDSGVICATMKGSNKTLNYVASNSIDSGHVATGTGSSGSGSGSGYGFADGHGTILRVHGLFHTLPVRQKAMKSSVELARIKDFLQHMSVLHHSITWTLLAGTVGEGEPGNILATSGAVHRKELWHQVGVTSVLKRLYSLHGLLVVSQMQVCSSIATSADLVLCDSSAARQYPRIILCFYVFCMFFVCFLFNRK
jgi:DNA mismatch repair ATPase MutL